MSKVLFFLEILRPDPCMHSLFLSASVILTCIPNKLIYEYVKNKFCLYFVPFEIPSLCSLRHSSQTGPCATLAGWRQDIRFVSLVFGREKTFLLSKASKLAMSPSWPSVHSVPVARDKSACVLKLTSLEFKNA